MASEDNDGVAYLKALRRTAGESAAAAASARESSGVSRYDAGESRQFAGPEKRRSPRYQCEGSAEIREEGHDVHTWAAFTDISLHGCYVEATATYPVGTPLEMKLEANGLQVRTKGTVRVTYPFLGMGIAFTEMADDDRARLMELLRTISRPTMVMGAPPLASGLLEAEAPISDPAAALRALTEFFETRQTLLKEEFWRILRKSQESAAKSGQ